MRRRRAATVGLLVLLLFLVWHDAAIADGPEPLTLSVNSVRETCTLGSVTTIDYAIEGGVPPYRLTVDGREVASGADPGLIRCNDSTVGSPFETISAAGARYIAVNATDSTGARVYKVVEVPLVPPLSAPPHLKVTSGVDGRTAADLLAEWTIPYSAREQPVEEVAIRWRNNGGAAWIVERRRAEQTGVFTYRATWTIESPYTGEQREAQVALLRHIYDLQVPETLRWSATALVGTTDHPHELQAEATHDTITLTWGPHVTGFTYAAQLRSIEPNPYGPTLTQRISSGALNQARFENLLPDTLYRVSVYLDEGRYPYALRMHEFELRTESAPDAWSWPTRIATDIQGFYLDGALELSWTPPDTGSRYETQVCVHFSDSYYHDGSACDTASPGEARLRLPLAPGQLGGMYLIQFRTQSLPEGVAEEVVHLPSYRRDLLTRGNPPEAPQFFEVIWLHFYREHPRPAIWNLRWNRDDADLTELSWQVDGRRFVRETRQSEFSFYLKRGQVPEAVRIRLLKGNDWTPWSDEADVGRIDASQRNVRFVERADTVEVHWDAPEDDSSVVGYRLYVTRERREERVIDVGRQVRAQVSIVPTDESMRADVGTLYEGPLEVVHFFHNWYVPQRQNGHVDSLGLHVYAQPSMCPPAEQSYAQVHWSISGGAGPYTVSIGNRLGFETHADSGYSVVECRTGSDGLLQEIPVSVMDAGGQSVDDMVGPEDVLSHTLEGQEDPFKITFGPRSVHRDRIWLTWEFCRWHYDAALRWRVSGTEQWIHVSDFAFDYHEYPWRCSGMLDGLAPLTTYEYQLARYISAEQLRQPERLPWSETQIVTTLGPPQELAVVRDGETVRVSWQRQPNAWAYLVRLRAEGRTWWKRYEPHGGTTETVYFYRVPQDLELSVELISPPLKHGEEEIPLDIDPRWSPGH